MRSRRKAREGALQALYQCDTLGEWSKRNVELYFKNFQSEEEPCVEHHDDEHNLFARKLIDGAMQNLEEIDGQITLASSHWSIQRMSRVDRNILRLATFEIGFLPDIPVTVCINEAIELAKRYGTDDSPMFVNGVLDSVARVFASRRAVADLKIAANE